MYLHPPRIRVDSSAFFDVSLRVVDVTGDVVTLSLNPDEPNYRMKVGDTIRLSWPIPEIDE